MRRSVAEHAAVVDALVAPALARLGSETVPLAAAHRRMTADPVRSPIALPPFRNSQMDGFAARADDLTDGVVLPVDGTIGAGPAARRRLRSGHLLRIMTGAPLPDGADCIVPVEDTIPAGDAVRVARGRAAGEFVREAGADLAADGILVEAGVSLAARHLAALASAGVRDLAVRRRPRVALLTTGAEIAEPGAALGFGMIFDANGPALRALVVEAGAEVASSIRTADVPDEFAEALDAAAAHADLVITSGGISQGDFEVVRQVLEPRGADVAEIAMQPGGPQATALLGRTPVICLPGNPVSTQVSFTVFLRPLLRAAAGLRPISPRRVALGAAIRSPEGRRQWLRGSLNGDTVVPVGGPGSHLVAALARADVLIDVPAAVTALPEGAEVDVLPL